MTILNPIHTTRSRLRAAIFRRLGVDGVYARTGQYEDVIEQLAKYISAERDPGAEVLRFPPVMSRQQLEKSGYLKSFPNLLGCVCHASRQRVADPGRGGSAGSGGDWTQSLAPADLVLFRPPATAVSLVAAAGLCPRPPIVRRVG